MSQDVFADILGQVPANQKKTPGRERKPGEGRGRKLLLFCDLAYRPWFRPSLLLAEWGVCARGSRAGHGWPAEPSWMDAGGAGGLAQDGAGGSRSEMGTSDEENHG